MLFYADGQSVQMGDSVDFDGEPGIVIEIVETQEQLVAAGFSEQMVGFRTKRFEAVYQAPNDRGWDAIALVNRLS